MALLLTAFAMGCGGSRAPILGGGGHAVRVIPGPQVSLTVPATTVPGPTPGAPTNTAISVAFSEAMAPASITGSSFRVTGPGGAALAGSLTNGSATAVFSPEPGLAPDTTYTVTLTTAVTSAAGAPLAGNQAPLPAASDYVWSFTTGAGPDSIRPQVSFTVPATRIPGPTPGIATGAAIAARFTEAMNPVTITPASFTLSGPGGAVVQGAVSYASATATFTPVAPLAAGTTYTATLTSAVTDLAGNQLAGDPAQLSASNYVWTFSTGLDADTTRPRVLLTLPATTVPGPTAGFPANGAITATFSEAMAASTITAASFTVFTALPGVSPAGSVSYDASSQTAWFTPFAALVAGTTYTAALTTAITDLSGNPLAGNQAPLPAAGNYVWTFIAGAPAASSPTITRTAPADTNLGVALDSSVHATFSEAMDPSTISTLTFKVQASGTPLGAPLAGAVRYDPAARMASFTASSPLLANTSYTATLTAAVGSLEASLAPGAVPNPWTFTTGTGLAPGSVSLGSAATFGIMATAAITSTGSTVINGNVSLQPGTAITGFPPGVVNGSVHINDSVSAQAQIDLLTAYTFAKSLPPGTTIAAGADLGALYPLGMPPGTYTSGSTMLVSSPLVLDAGGNADAVWVFQIGSSLTTGASVALANGAQAGNVFWVPTLDGTVGVGTIFTGTLIAGRSVTGVTGSTINGRILAGATTAGTIALQATTVNVPTAR